MGLEHPATSTSSQTLRSIRSASQAHAEFCSVAVLPESLLRRGADPAGEVLSPVQNNDHEKLLVVMVLTPGLMNLFL